MQITDHDTCHYGKKTGFKFWVGFQDATGENSAWINFADFASWLVAAGEFDGYDDSTDEGELWRYLDDEQGRCESYSFAEIISEFMITGDFDGYLSDYLRVKMTIEEMAA